MIPAPEIVKVKYVLFDMDGLLLNTEDIYSKVTTDILARFGKEYDWTIKKKLIGLREDEACKLLVDLMNIPMTAAEYSIERTKGHQALFPSCRPLPGVMKLVKHLVNKRVKICVATSSSRAAFNLKAQENNELFDLFNGNIVCGDDAGISKGKPAPDIFLAAAKQITAGIAYGGMECLVFEDAPSGVLAAKAAGMRICWIPDTRLERDSVIVQMCDDVQSSIESVDLEQFGLCPYED